MTTADKIAVTLLALFIAGIAGGLFSSLAWLWLCAPLLVAVAFVMLAIALANRHFKGLRLW